MRFGESVYIADKKDTTRSRRTGFPFPYAPIKITDTVLPAFYLDYVIFVFHYVRRPWVVSDNRQ
jgi:hypothetical protein